MAEVHLPSDLITDILSRLPVKSLLQFRSVSKQWCSLIDSPRFINLHINKSVHTNSNHSLIIKSCGPLSSLDFDSLQNLTPISHTFLQDFPIALDCCNGLHLIQLRLNITLFNPSTRKHFTIPSCDFDHRPLSIYNFLFSFGFGLGFDHVADDYKVIRLVDSKSDDDKKWAGSELSVYSLKSNSWKKINKLFPYGLPDGHPWGVSLQGGYNAIVKKYCGRDWPKLLVSIDFATDDYKTLPLPDIFQDEGLEGLSLGKLGNCLCLAVLSKTFYQNFWVMKEYGVEESWTKLLSTPAPGIDSAIDDSMTIIAYSKCGEKILFTYGDSEFVWFDLKRRDFAKVPVSGLPLLFHCYVCVDSLVRPDVYGKFANNGESEPKMKENKTRKLRDNLLSVGFN